ncbi:hypothetical protein EMIHUDRAFT_216624 [Emiliania huxleyi CCMP1516]|uniref:Uncharacterized protein n=2 Tax=Emiliania huxleyi TaxID=2903 RepID=A0A0D3IDB7_EMIH1|nr:hypothetical protein EMIHUDRAFT_216624 [Emiliania huxleyi CCMP1516]EOD09252.1 hypothetical protein EMIHUDRAFT_216624 [Emiliania huxleyi CCMP1516]|eukprot:XP_005761681.1 hypothetical protein EMIHUDRAFT_216624 [Emiliania huxleyi CCMP1516]
MADEAFVFPVDDAQALWEELEVGGTPPSPRQGHSSCRLLKWGQQLPQRALLYVFGGINAAALSDSAGSECYDDLHVLDARDSAMTWRQLSRGASASWPQRRAFHTATAIDSRAFLVFGGATPLPPKRYPRRRSRASSGAAVDEGNPVAYLNDVWQFRGEDQAWVCGGAVLDDLWLLSVRQRRGRRVLLFGGRSDVDAVCAPVMFALDLASLSWDAIPAAQRHCPGGGRTSMISLGAAMRAAEGLRTKA